LPIPALSALARPEDDCMSFPDHNERRQAAEAAKKAMLEKFKNKAQVAPEVAAQRAAEAKAREEKRLEAERRRRERVELEKLERKLAAEEKARAEAEAARLAAEEAERKRIADAEAAEILAFEQKARRDLRYAARKARQGK
jgi:hypothetical protein